MDNVCVDGSDSSYCGYCLQYGTPEWCWEDYKIYDAYSLFMDILNKAKKEIIIIDNHAGKELLDILKNIKTNIVVVSSNIDDTLKKSMKCNIKM